MYEIICQERLCLLMKKATNNCIANKYNILLQKKYLNTYKHVSPAFLKYKKFNLALRKERRQLQVAHDLLYSSK